MPAAAASRAVLETVVAPLSPSAAATGRSRTPSLARPGSAQIRSISHAVSPTCGTPSRTAIVAGTPPPARTAGSMSPAAARVSGGGGPGPRRGVLTGRTGASPRHAAGAAGGGDLLGGRGG